MSARSLCALLVLLLVSACKNPARDVPAATTAEATEAAAPAAEATEPAVAPEASEPAAPAPAPSAILAGREIILDATNTRVGFVGAKLTASHEGSFGVVSGIVRTGASISESSVEVTVPTGSVVVEGEERLTAHLKSPDFFDIGRFPAATFASTSIALVADSAYHVTGTLDLHGVKKEVTFPAEITLDGSGLTMTAEFSINRQEWGIVYAGMADDLIRDEVVIKLAITTTN